MVNLKIHFGPATCACAAHAHKTSRRGFRGGASESESRKRPVRDETTPSANPPNAGTEAIGNPARRIFGREHDEHAEHSPSELRFRVLPESGTAVSNTHRWIPWLRYRRGIVAPSRPTRADPV